MEFNKKSALPIALFCLYLGKTFFIPASWSESLILCVLGGLVAYSSYKNENKLLTNLNEKLEKQEKDIDYLKSQLAGIKLATGMRNISGR